MLKGMRNTVLASAVAVAAAPVAADWQHSQYDNGAIFSGSAGPEGRLFSLRCTNLSRQGLDLVMMGSHEETQTAPGQLLVSVSPNLVPLRGIEHERSDLIVWADGTGYRLPRVSFNEFSGDGWEAQVGIADPMVLALMSASTVIVGAEAGPHYQLDSTSMGSALRQTVQFCLGEYARMGAPVPPALAGLVPNAATAAQDPNLDMRRRAGVEIRRGCGGGYMLRGGGDEIMTGDIDGDGIEDAVVNWGGIHCGGADPRPFCGASMCSTFVLLTARGGRPMDLMSLGASLVPLNNGRMGVSVGGSLAECHHAGKGDGGCQFIWYWNGQDMVQLP